LFDLRRPQTRVDGLDARFGAVTVRGLRVVLVRSVVRPQKLSVALPEELSQVVHLEFARLEQTISSLKRDRQLVTI
jgi:hypothetical protein